MFALIAQEGQPDGFQRIFDDGYCKNCSKIRGSCSSRDPARRVSPAGPLCHCFAGIMRSNCALEEGRREERENKKKEEGEKRKKRKRRKRKERGTNRVGRTIDREEKKSPLLCPQESRGLRECFARVLCTRVPVRAGKVESERKSAFDRCVAARCVLAFNPSFDSSRKYRSNSSIKTGYRFHFHSRIEWRQIFYFLPVSRN